MFKDTPVQLSISGARSQALAEAGEQAWAWRERRNALIIQAAVVNISYRQVAEYVGLSDVVVGRIARPSDPRT